MISLREEFALPPNVLLVFKLL